MVSSIEKSPADFRNRPVNISHCVCLTKEYFFSPDLTAYLIWFEGCLNDRGERLSWGYPTQEERDADYDRILKAFPAVSPEESDRERIIEVLADTTETQPVHSPAEPEPEPVKKEEVLEHVINWLEDNATAHVVQALRKAYGGEK